jgi:hypothetical protein
MYAQRPSTLDLFSRTLPYVVLRMVAYAIFGLVLIFFAGAMAGIGFVAYQMFKGAAGALVVVGLIAIGGIWALVSLGQRYVLYIIKTAHVAVITEIILHGDLPAGVDQVSYGREKVTKHFGSASAMFAVDQIISGAVREILRWLTGMAGFLSIIPGMTIIISIVRQVLGIAGNYIDEAVMSYIIAHENEDVWRSAADGVVLYAQSWKRMLWTAAILSLVVAAGWLVFFIIILLALLGISRGLTNDSSLQLLYGFIALVIAAIMANILRWIIVDPLATVAIVANYTDAIRGQTPSYDLRSQLSSISGKFRRLEQKVV